MNPRIVKGWQWRMKWERPWGYRPSVKSRPEAFYGLQVPFLLRCLFLPKRTFFSFLYFCLIFLFKEGPFWYTGGFLSQDASRFRKSFFTKKKDILRIFFGGLFSLRTGPLKIQGPRRSLWPLPGANPGSATNGRPGTYLLWNRTERDRTEQPRDRAMFI